VTILPCQTLPGLEAQAATGTPPPAAAADRELERISKDFEAVLTATMLKQGLSESSVRWDEGDEDQSGNTFKEFAYEQIAYAVGQQGVLGISDQIRDQLRSLKEGDRNGHDSRHTD